MHLNKTEIQRMFLFAFIRTQIKASDVNTVQIKDISII